MRFRKKILAITPKILIIVVFVLTLFACNRNFPTSRDVHTIETKPFSPKNPTFYEFAHPLPKVREKLLAAFEDFHLKNRLCSSLNETKSCLFSVGNKEDPSFSQDIFANPENSNDIYLYPYDLIGPSPIYFGGGKPLEYRAEFQLHLTDAGNNRTKISVITHKSTVINGEVCCSPHGYYSNYVPVEPTTIEEYKILLFIGSVLGANEMPPLRLPEPEK